MELGFREILTGIGLVGSWAIALTTVKVQSSGNAKQIDEIKAEYKNAINRLEESLKKEDEALNSRLQLKRQLFDEFKDEIKEEITKLKEQSQRFLHTEKATETFVSKSEWQLLIDNMNIQFKMLDKQYNQLDKKMDDILEYLKGDK